MDHREDACRFFTCVGRSQDKTIINRIMLGFRPIAPKPAGCDGSSGSWKTEENKGMVTAKRKKRKYVRVKKNIEYRTRTKKAIRCPQLDLNETGDLQQLAAYNCGSSSKVPKSFSSADLVIVDKVQVQDDRLGYRGKEGGIVAETWVRVESVADMTSIDVLGLGRSDIERKRNLERDTCPGFISDGLNRVEWINEAYRKMACLREAGESESESEVRVRLEVKEKVLPYEGWFKEIAAFTCWVRLQYTWRMNKCCLQMVPCDVWRMDFGGFAWRLDFQAALGLGIQNNIGK